MDGWIDRENIGEQRRQIIEKWMEKETSKQIGKGIESGRQRRRGDKDRQ